MKLIKTFEAFSDSHKELHSAILAGDYNKVVSLIESGADISQRNYMVVKTAAEEGKARILQLLLDEMAKVADLNTQTRVKENAEKFVSSSNLSERQKSIILNILTSKLLERSIRRI